MNAHERFAMQDQMTRQAAFQKNLNALYERMSNLADDVNDREICRRLKVFIQTVPADLSPEHSREIRHTGRVQTESEIPEAILPFYRHYLFMRKRAESKNPRSA